MSGLRLYLLGSPHYELDGESLRLKLRKVEALLIYLAVTGKTHRREALIALLYPELDRERAFANFRHTLSVLKSAVGELYLSVDPDSVALKDNGEVWTDVMEFRRLIEESSRTSDGDEGSESVRLFEEAAGLWGGEFLAGFSLDDCPDFEEWRFFEAEGLERDYASQLRRLVRHHSERGEYQKAAEYGRKLVTLDPLDESAHRSLMRLYGLSGQRSAALRQYDQCKAVLTRELGRMPEAETEALREAIAAGTPAPAAPKKAAAPSNDTASAAPSTPAEAIPTTVRKTAQPEDAKKAPDTQSGAERPTNLRMALTRLIGRERELAAVVDMLRRDEIRLLTLTGTGGTGKTRLALEAASHLRDYFEHGVFFIDLAPLEKPDQVVPDIVTSLNIIETVASLETGAEAKRERRSPIELLCDYLRRKQLLLVLDNFEHVIEAGPEVTEILSRCPQVKVLATSREALRLRGEQELPVPPLMLPELNQSFDSLKQSEAVRLFAERAAAAAVGFEMTEKNAHALAGICARLDGLPLAIELAAARTKVYQPQALLQRLDDRLGLLRDGPRDLPQRQRTLRNEIDWSYELLSEDEKTVFRRLSVFAGGCTMEAAAAVCSFEDEHSRLDASECLLSLYEKSLFIKHDTSAGPRFLMLQTIKEYAAGRLEESGERETVLRRLALYCVDLAERAEPGMKGPEWRTWFARLDAEYDNIRSALAWLQQEADPVLGSQLAGAMGWYWFRRARYTEGQHWLELFRSAADEKAPPESRAKVSYYLGWINMCTGRVHLGNPEVKSCFDESVLLWRKTEVTRGLACALVMRGWAGWGGNPCDPLADAETESSKESTSLARGTADPWVIAFCVVYDISYMEKDDRGARQTALEETLIFARESEDHFLVCRVLKEMGDLGFRYGDWTYAKQWYSESLRAARDIDDKWSIFDIFNRLGRTYLMLDQVIEAKTSYREGLLNAADVGARGYFGWLIGGLDHVAMWEGNLKRATRLWAAAAAIATGFKIAYNSFKFDELDPPRSAVLDQEEGAPVWDAGQAMTIDEAIAYALTDED